jgi:vanillate/3-O-methylgallate O-demethylase
MDMQRALLVCTYASRVLAGGQDVGVATSRGYSFYYRKMISHCVIDIGYAQPGTEVTVIWGEPGKRQKEIRAVVHPYPFKRNMNRETDLAALPARPNA